MNDTLSMGYDDAAPLLARAGLLCELDRHEEILKLLMPLLLSVEPAVEGYRYCVYALQSLERHYEALALVEQALTRYPDEPDLHAMYASALGYAGMYQKALVQAERALAADPENASYHYLTSIALHNLNRNQEACDAAASAVELEPSNVDYRVFLATLEYLVDNNKRAEELIDVVLHEEPRNADALSLKGMMSKGLWRKKRLYQQALAISPTGKPQQDLYVLYTRQFSRDLALNGLLIVAIALIGAFRGNGIADCLQRYYIPIAVLAGFYLIKRTCYHLIAFMVMLAAVQIIGFAWLGEFDAMTVPVAALISFMWGIFILIIKFSLINILDQCKENLSQLRSAHRHGRTAILIQDWFPARVAAASIALALVPTSMLFLFLSSGPDFLEYVIIYLPVLIPFLYRAAGIPSFKTCVITSFWLVSWLLLPMVFLSIKQRLEPGFRPFALVIMFLIALFLAHRQYKMATQGDCRK